MKKTTQATIHDDLLPAVEVEPNPLRNLKSPPIMTDGELTDRWMRRESESASKALYRGNAWKAVHHLHYMRLLRPGSESGPIDENGSTAMEILLKVRDRCDPLAFEELAAIGLDLRRSSMEGVEPEWREAIEESFRRYRHKNHGL